jgi:hypothetical protein
LKTPLPFTCGVPLAYDPFIACLGNPVLDV